MWFRRRFLRIVVTLTLFGAALASPSSSAAQDAELPLAPDQVSATYGSAVADASLVYLEIYFRVYVRDPQLGVYLNDGFPFEITTQCTGWGVAANHLITASHCIQNDVQWGTVPYEIVRGPATDWAFDVGLYPGLTREEIQDLGLGEWEVEGDSANSPPEREIFASYGVVQSGLQGQAGTSTARVVDNIPFDQGDVALISIQDPGSLASAPVPVIEIAEGTPAVGSEILSLGYPGVVGGLTQGQTQSPSIQDGRISAVATTSVGGYQVFEVSSNIDQGMSGGPTVNFAGQVVGVNSFGAVGNLNTFGFVSPADRFVGELLARNGVVNELSGTDITYRQAVTQFLAGNYTEAIALFDETLERMPAHRRAQEFRVESVRLRDQVGDTAVAPDTSLQSPTSVVTPTAAVGTDTGGGSNTAAIVLILLGLLAATGAVLAYLRKTRPAIQSEVTSLPTASSVALPVTTSEAAHVETAHPETAHVAVTEELERLSALHKAGELTDEEFAELKHQVLHGSAAEQ